MCDVPYTTSRYGFTWGPVTVTRMAVMPRGAHIVTVNDLDIYVSKTGRSVRVFRDGKELRADAAPAPHNQEDSDGD